MGKSIHIKNLNKVLKRLDDFGDVAKKQVDVITEQNARELELNAKRLVRAQGVIDQGKLLQNIKAIKVGDVDSKSVNWKVFANAFGNAPYSAYHEFGTGGMVSVPAELKEMAILFKGKGIRRVDIRPRPFMYPSLVRQRVIYVQDLNDLLNDLSKGL